MSLLLLVLLFRPSPHLVEPDQTVMMIMILMIILMTIMIKSIMITITMQIT